MNLFHFNKPYRILYTVPMITKVNRNRVMWVSKPDTHPHKITTHYINQGHSIHTLYAGYIKKINTINKQTNMLQ